MGRARDDRGASRGSPDLGSRVWRAPRRVAAAGRVPAAVGPALTDPPHLRWRDPAAPGPGRILTRAHELLAYGWCQGAEARDADGAETNPWSPLAVRWSLLGALVAAVDLPPDPPLAYLGPLRRALAALAEVIDEPSLAGWNDAPARSKDDVLGIVDAARYVCARWEGA